MINVTLRDHVKTKTLAKNKVNTKLKEVESFTMNKKIGEFLKDSMHVENGITRTLLTVNFDYSLNKMTSQHSKHSRNELNVPKHRIKCTR